MTEQGQEKNGTIKSIVKAAKAINVLAAAGQPMSLAAMSKELQISKSTLHGIISTLVDVKFIAQDQQSGRYRLGTRLFELGSAISNQWDVRKIGYPIIQQIVAGIGETVHMAVLDDYEVLYINKLESTSSIRIVTDVGAKLPAYCTGLGKALLSGMSRLELQCYVSAKGLAKKTENTITTFDGLWKEMQLIRLRGYAIDEQEFVEGLRCCAAPIRNHAGAIVSAISISGPISRIQGEKFDLCKKTLQKAAEEISLQMGYENKR